MGFYQFRNRQIINMPIEKVWSFISDPRNLKKITPEHLGFDITTENLPEKIYAGMIISYSLTPLWGIKTTWVTEITHLKEGEYFVDEQRVGPYKIWHHQHILEASSKGTIMTDIVSYSPPFGLLGDIANQMIIKSKLKEIFEYRTKVLSLLS